MVDNKKNRGKQNYEPGLIEKKWQQIWDKTKIYSPNLDNAKKPFYNLMMFPYPSASGMHVGNMYAFTGADVYGRFMRMQGFDVFEPIGLDGFGIHSENFAIKVSRHPKEQAKVSESNFYRQLRATGNGFDWSRKLETYDPKYYKWTQWLFIQLFKSGLAYRKKAAVNFCPSCKTVLADEQVITKSITGIKGITGTTGRIDADPRDTRGTRATRGTSSEETREISVNVCERCETEVIKKDLEQWFFRITKYADRLLANLGKLDWTEKVKIAQKQWIGRSEGARIRFKIYDLRFKNEDIEVFTTRPDTLYGATFLVLSPEHRLVAELLKSKFKSQKSKVDEVKRYVDQAKKKTEQERLAEGKEKTGVFTGLYAINPVNNEKIPIWIADYVLMGYGTGAIMGVPAHDSRDYEFSKKYKLPIKVVVVPLENSKFKIQNSKLQFKIKNEWREGAYEGEGKVINSGSDWEDFYVPDAISKIIDWLEQKGIGKKEVTYHLRDWLISRQRYWGPPIPMIFCKVCAKKGNSWFAREERFKIYDLRFKNKIKNHKSEMAGWFPVPEKDLPVLLPDVKDWKPLGIHSPSSGQAVKSPLANHPEFYKVACPNCGGEARRETDVSDTFLDSSWYFLRYLSTEFDYMAFPAPAFINPKSEALNPKQIQNSNDKNSKQFRISNFDIRVSAQRAARWLPVNMYIGGAEHSVLHLLYSRFITMALYDLGFIDFSGEARPGSAWDEPFSRFFAHGLLIREGAKMSKSRGNVVVPDEYIKKFGADTLRMYLMFLGPFNQGGDFYDTGIEGMQRFVKRVWNLVLSIKYHVSINSESTELDRAMNKTIKLVTEDLQSLHYNTAIARLMEYYNTLRRFYTKYKILNTKYCKTLVLLLAPFAPHVTEELWSRIIADQNAEKRRSAKISVYDQRQSAQWSIHLQPWPIFDPKYLEEDEVTIVVQVNGKLRDTIKSQKSKVKSQKFVEESARKSDKVIKYLEGKEVKKVVYVEGKVINFVTQ